MPASLKNALRWIAVIPAAVGAFFAIQILGIIGAWMMPAYFLQLSNSYLGPMAFVAAGAYTAPRFRFATALVLTIGECTIISIVLLLLLAGEVTPSNGTSRWWAAINCGVSLVATILTCYGIHRGVVDKEIPD
jgi:hypothetical protein